MLKLDQVTWWDEASDPEPRTCALSEPLCFGVAWGEDKTRSALPFPQWPRCSHRLSHSWMWQVRVWTEEPSHRLLRLSQERPRCWIPLPQVAEQEVHSDHGDQPSSAESLAAEGTGLLVCGHYDCSSDCSVQDFLPLPEGGTQSVS